MRDERRVETLTAGNRRVKEARKLSRRSVRTERRLFLADGPKAVEGALSAVLDDGTPCVVEVFATPAAARQHAAVLDGAPVTLVDERALAALSDAVTPAGVVAVCRHLDVPLSTLLRPPVGGRAAARNEGRPPEVGGRAAARHERRPPEVGGRAAARNERRVETIAVCADVRDPGNAGTVIRTADAAGADAVVLAGSSVDAYNPKTVRATVGSLFRLPVAIEPDPRSAVEAARSAGLTVLAADGGGELDLFATDDLLAGPTAWLFGNEARGLPADLAALADHRVAIPILGGAESLNLSTAAAVCLYASARVKRAARSASEERA